MYVVVNLFMWLKYDQCDSPYMYGLLLYANVEHLYCLYLFKKYMSLLSEFLFVSDVSTAHYLNNVSFVQLFFRFSPLRILDGCHDPDLREVASSPRGTPRGGPMTAQTSGRSQSHDRTQDHPKAWQHGRTREVPNPLCTTELVPRANSQLTQ